MTAAEPWLEPATAAWWRLAEDLDAHGRPDIRWCVRWAPDGTLRALWDAVDEWYTAQGLLAIFAPDVFRCVRRCSAARRGRPSYAPRSLALPPPGIGWLEILRRAHPEPPTLERVIQLRGRVCAEFGILF